MCDIWKDNKNTKQLTEEDIQGLMQSLQKLGTQQVVMSGGEALLNPNFFRFCEILKQHRIKVTLLSTGMTLKKQAEQIVQHVHDLIVSLDGDEATHNYIRNIPDAYNKLRDGVRALKFTDPSFRVSSRTVIHKINFRNWHAIIDSAKEIGIDQVSFLPADVSSHAFNREVLWSDQRQHEILPARNELPELHTTLVKLTATYKRDFDTRYIAESPEKLHKIYSYYAAFHGLNPFPFKKCNAPWVSAVVEADGTVRPCFFHEAIGNIRTQSFDQILNSKESVHFRKELDMETNPTCLKCVCYLNLPPRMSPVTTP
jgi:MoaA/NifB/PqqE/SkfB family radical SAM enzyme